MIEVFIVKPHDFDPVEKVSADSQRPRRPARSMGRTPSGAIGRFIPARATWWLSRILMGPRLAAARISLPKFPAIGAASCSTI